MAEHSTLTGSDLHEPKGVASAAAGTVYVANGSGSGAWSNPLSGFNHANSQMLFAAFEDIATPGSVFFYVPYNCKIIHSAVILYGAITGAPAVVQTFINGTYLTGEDLTIPFAGSGSGSLSTHTYTYGTTINGGSVIRMDTDGGPTNSGAIKAIVQLEIQYV